MMLEKRFDNLMMAVFLPFLMLFYLTPVFAQKGNQDKEPHLMVTESGIEYEVTDWDSRLIYNPLTYSYVLWETPVYKTIKTTEIYPVPLSDFDQPPVFSEACVSSDVPIICTNEQLQKFMLANDFNYPVDAKRNYQEGLEYVTFTLNKEGEFEGRPTVLSKSDPCKGCSDKAVEIVMQTSDKWQPAVLDGRPVSVRLTIPVRFQLQDNPIK
jgi:hypothetical protein